MGRKGKGPIRPKPRTIRKQPVAVTAFGGFLSEIMPQMGADPPVKSMVVLVGFNLESIIGLKRTYIL
jgi:hypothetical protein